MALGNHTDIIEVHGGPAVAGEERFPFYSRAGRRRRRGLDDKGRMRIVLGDEPDRFIEFAHIETFGDDDLTEEVAIPVKREHSPVDREEVSSPAQRRELNVHRNDIDERGRRARGILEETIRLEVDGKAVSPYLPQKGPEKLPLLERLSPRHAYRMNPGGFFREGTDERRELARINRIGNAPCGWTISEPALGAAIARARRIAIDAAKRAPREPDEDLENAHVRPLPLDGAENLGDIPLRAHRYDTARTFLIARSIDSHSRR